ncbi:hypothetical protein Cgig2_024171 [Carnegiea gigantea]|uniref:NB-ARC domain-containing protein n=1 Tax=Carnegiea gigantea TaxID=171969 RepID=A0A9Q1KAW1_9CARY|nr:hypothetical protein Cgig2_024171 [Carnegiea gigantea]
MAELGLDIPRILMEKLISGAVKEACSFSQIKSLIKTLEETKPIIEAWLLDADATQLTNHAERVAFEQLISALEKMNTSLDVREARAMRRQIVSGSRPIKKALSFETRAFTSEVVVGRDRDRDNIIRMLLESSTAQETFSMVCIVGIGGTGKTALAQYVFSNDRVKSHFDMMIWVYVPQVLIAEDVMQRMVAFATDETHLQWGMLQLQYQFQRQITNKKILLVLDNVWDHQLLSLQCQELRDLIGFCAPGSLVLSTTRSVGVAKTMGIVNRYMLKDLEKEDSWHLFKRVAFTQGQDPRVEAIGREIVHLCPDVPLVIRYVVESQSESQSLLDIARDYFHRLKDQGFFDSNWMHSYWMHDLIHDLACWVAGPAYKRVYSSQGYEFDEERIRHLSLPRERLPSTDLPYSLLNKTKKQLHSLLVSRDAFMNTPKLNLAKFECLRVLSIRRAGLIEMPRTISKLITLRFLDLSGNKFTKLPDSLTQLVNLLFLNLSLCMELQKLPRGLSKLQNLLELDLHHCRIPKGHEQACEAKRASLMPVGLGNFTGLEKLDLFVAKGPSSSRTIPSGSDDYEVGGLAELNRLNNLEGTLAIKVDGKWSSESEARAANLQGKEKLTALWIEFVGGSSRDNEMMLEGFQPNANLKSLGIEGYKGERIPSWIHDRDYPSNLRQIWIRHWKTRARICLGSFGRLPHLQFLDIPHLPDLEYIESTTTATPLFPTLRYLAPEELPKLKGCFSGGVGATTFPRLFHLKLSSVGLEVVPEEFHGLSSLSYLHIRGCNLLKGIPEWIETLTSLETVVLSCPQLTSSPEQMLLNADELDLAT